MQISRRGVVTMVGGVALASAGCLERVRPGQSGNGANGTTADPSRTTEEFPIDDIWVKNDREEVVEVTVSVTRGSESVLEETFTLDPDETETYEDVMENEREYEVTVSADGLTKTVTFEEHRDNAGVEFSIGPEKIESVEIVH